MDDVLEVGGPRVGGGLQGSYKGVGTGKVLPCRQRVSVVALLSRKTVRLVVEPVPRQELFTVPAPYARPPEDDLAVPEVISLRPRVGLVPRLKFRVKGDGT